MTRRSRLIYLDHHSTTPVDSRVLEEMLPYFTEDWGNAASKDHVFGHVAEQAVEDSRRSIAAALGARPDEIVFTSGATESNNLALAGAVSSADVEHPHVITSSIEHPAVLDCLAALREQGTEVTQLTVDEYGRVRVEDVAEALQPNTILVSVMAANNEIGTLQPLRAIGELTRERGLLFHTDAAQALGYMDLDVRTLNVDLLSGSGHKVYGPKGIGLLYVSRRRPRIELTPLIRGGGHEAGMRSGTLNVPGIVGLAAALRLAAELRGDESRRLRALTERMWTRLNNEIGAVRRHGHPSERLPHNLNVRFDGVRAKALVVNLPELAFSTGSACTTAKAQPSHVLQALGLPKERVREAVRFGLGRSTTQEEVDYAVDRIKDVVGRLRKMGVAVVVG